MEEGFEAMGKPIPFDRRQAAYEAVRHDMIPDASAGDAIGLVNIVADALERDEPYHALSLATGGAPIARDPRVTSKPAPSDYPALKLDVTGGYRLLAHLLTGGRS